MLASLCSLPISVSHILNIEGNKFFNSSNQLYDAGLLTRGYTQHAFCLYSNSEINHKNFIHKLEQVPRGSRIPPASAISL